MFFERIKLATSCFLLKYRDRVISVGGGDLCAVGLPRKKIVSVLGQTSGRTNPIVTRLSERRADRPTSGGEVLKRYI